MKQGNGSSRTGRSASTSSWPTRHGSCACRPTSTACRALTDQTGQAFEPAGAWLDDQGGVLFSDASTPARVAALHDHDLGLFADHATLDEQGTGGRFHWRPGVDLALAPIGRDEVPARFAFVASPAARAAG